MSFVCFLEWSAHPTEGESAELNQRSVTLVYRQNNAHPTVHPLLCCVTPSWFSDVLLIWNILAVYLLLVLLPFVSSPGTGTRALLWLQLMWLNQLNGSELNYLLIYTLDY